jgi:hypothetical protein
MQIIQLKKFGKVLISRPAGLEAFNAIRPALNKNDRVQIDFEDVFTVTPSWLDEFLTHIVNYTEGNVELLPTKNAAVLAALPVLAGARQDKVGEVMQQALRRMHLENGI